ncbi:hypothetical protein [Sphaerisporangium rhizosphaerae]|uniref:DUF2599 domain-containing protein n=1 Tax=Sphaerisporangium rhizosphaerae TaxID=2269375 RepID=A0ABW2NX00_9ACTN
MSRSKIMAGLLAGIVTVIVAATGPSQAMADSSTDIGPGPTVIGPGPTTARADSSGDLPAPPAHRVRIELTNSGGATSEQGGAPKAGIASLAGGAYGSPKYRSSYYDGSNGAAFLWRAPGCGWWNFGSTSQFNPVINDRLTSVDNNSASYLDLYNWTGTWTYMGTIFPWTAGNLPSAYNNIVDAVDISC